MTVILGALAPVFLLILAGAVMRGTGFPGEGFWVPLDRLIFYVLFPALLVERLANADLQSVSVGPVAAATILATVIVSGALIAARPLRAIGAPAFVSLFMGAIRFNTFVGIGAAGALYGEAGLTLAAIVIAVQVPLVNALSVLVIVATIGPDGARSGHSRHLVMLWEVLRNPLILACMIGAALNAGGLALPAIPNEILKALGDASLPLALLASGAGLSFRSLTARRGVLAATLAAKLLVMPLVTIATCAAFGVGGLTAKIAILFAALPSATSAYIIARQMGGDSPLVAAAITLSTVAAAVTMPVVLTLFG